MADKLGLKTGQRIFAYFIDNNGVRTGSVYHLRHLSDQSEEV